MSTFLILEYASCSTTPLFVEIVGLIFLYGPKIPSTLVHTESACLTRSILYFIISSVDLLWCLYIYLVKLYYFFMIMLTLDRLLDFYWNIKYSIYFRPKKLLKILYSIIVAFTTIFVLISVFVINCIKIAFSTVNTVALPTYIIFHSLYLRFF